ncbi:hypothetical protein HY468_04605 [Candidatus Roizmanbacteria bacterium]|nr:hypothetical protein [Candidatus Roizmanbacteria bacterium]
MSITYLTIPVINPMKPKKRKEEQFLVDFGAIYSVVPVETLEKLDIRPTDTQKFTLANGEVIEKKVGNALFEYRGKVRSSPVVFGEKGIFLLGAVTLESLGAPSATFCSCPGSHMVNSAAMRDDCKYCTPHVYCNHEIKPEAIQKL